MRLDDLYKMVVHIYGEQNVVRPTASTFAHFVEVCGMLTIHDRKKKREGVTVTDALCKALGWYFPLLAKMKIKSVEELVYRKFPYACPYCGLAPHQDGVCKLVRGTASTVDHQRVLNLYERNATKRPGGLDDWQKMFQDIYPREADDRGRSTIGLLEELGELAEAIRVFDRHPKYFVGEAADTFSYLMGIANEHALRMQQDQDKVFSFEEEFLRRYPGLCTQCGSRVCVCPTVPEATVGRMAKELDLRASSGLFIDDLEEFNRDGRKVAHQALERAGGYSGLLAKLPFDRGDVNHALMLLCLRVATAIETSNSEFADRLRAEAIRIGSIATYPGSARRPFDAQPLLKDLVEIWRGLDLSQKASITGVGADLLHDIGDAIGKIRVLFVFCSPVDENRLHLSGEFRAVLEAIKLGNKKNDVIVEPLPAATVDDLRRALLSASFEIIHFSGHADERHLIFENSNHESAYVPLQAVRDLIQRQEAVRCVILNGCKSAKALSEPIGPVTVGMTDIIADDAATEFSRGFYDAVSAGKSMDIAIEEGLSAVALKGLDNSPITVLRQEP